MFNCPPTPTKANTALALVSVLNCALHVRLAVSHNLASELESPQLAAAYKAGQYPSPSWTTETQNRAIGDLRALRQILMKSLLQAMAIACVFIGVTALLGKVSPSLPVDYGKTTSAIGAVLAAWAALLQLSPVRVTYRGSMLHERAYAAAVRVLAVLGVLLADVGSLWWQ